MKKKKKRDSFDRREFLKIVASAAISGPFCYSAVLGDADLGTFSTQLERYLQAGFSDFKVKLSGPDTVDST